MADGDCISSVVGGPSGSAFALPTNVALGAGYVAAGANPAQSGSLRMANNTALKTRDFANTYDASLCYVDAADAMFFGDPGGGFATEIQGYFVNIRAANSYVQVFANGAFYIYSGGGLSIVNDGAQIQSLIPMVGYSTPTGAVDGMVTKAMANTNQVLTGLEYNMSALRLTGALTATRTVTFPSPADDGHSYVKTIWCQTSNFGVTIKTSSGFTVLLAANDAPRTILFHPLGCTLVL